MWQKTEASFWLLMYIFTPFYYTNTMLFTVYTYLCHTPYSRWPDLSLSNLTVVSLVCAHRYLLLYIYCLTCDWLPILCSALLANRMTRHYTACVTNNFWTHQWITKIHDILYSALSKWVVNTACILPYLLNSVSGQLRSGLHISPFVTTFKDTVSSSEVCLHGCINWSLVQAEQ